MPAANSATGLLADFACALVHAVCLFHSDDVLCSCACVSADGHMHASEVVETVGAQVPYVVPASPGAYNCTPKNTIPVLLMDSPVQRPLIATNRCHVQA